MLGSKGGSATARAPAVVMLLENNPYPDDVRVRREAESLVSAGYAVRVIAPRAKGQPARERVRDVDVIRFRIGQDRPSVLGFVREYLVANLHLHVLGAIEVLRGARVVHLHNPPDTLFILGGAARALGRSVVFDHHDLAPELAGVKFGHRSLVWILRRFERATFAVADLVICPNHSHRRVAETRGKVPPDRIVVVRNGPPASVIGLSTPPRPGRLDDPVLVFLGEMAAQDGVDELPELLRTLVHDHRLLGARLTLIGKGPRRAALEAAFAAEGLLERVTFTGHVRQSEVFAHLAAADMCVDPAPRDAYSDACTMTKIAEYMAAGRPVVAHRLTETFQTAGGAARYASAPGAHALAEVVSQLAGSPDERLAMAAQGQDRVGELTWEHSERALIAAYDRLTAGR